MTLANWSFSDPEPHQTADGKHTFYRVRGERSTKREYYGLSTPVNDYGFMSVPVDGEGPTPEEALHAAMRKAAQEDERARDMVWNVQVGIMGGSNFRR